MKRMYFIKRMCYGIFLILCFVVMACENDGDYSKELSEVAAKMTKKCPQMLDSETRIDKLEFISPNTLVYEYTLINVNAFNVDTILFKQNLWPGILSNIKVSAEMQKLREHKTTILYTYYDRGHKPIYTFSVFAKDYTH